MIKNLKINYELLLITILAFALRLINLGKLNLWFDEGCSAGYVHSGLSFIFRESFTAEPNPPLYNILLSFWVKFFGESEFSLRMPSAIFGALGISLIYLIGKKYVSRRIGILAAILIIGNPFYLAYSQEARVYAFFAFLCLCSAYYFPINFDFKDKNKYLAVTLLVPWAHAYGVFLLLAQNIYVLMAYRSKKLEVKFIKSWITIQTVIILLASSWYIPFLLHSEKNARRFRWIKPITPKEIFELLQSYIGLGLFEALVIISIILWIKKRDVKSRGVRSLFLWLLFTITIPIIVGSFWHPFLAGRYTIAASMVFGIVILAPMNLIIEESKKLFLVCLLVVSLFSAWEANNYFKTIRKQEWMKAVETILLEDKSQITVALEEYYESSSLDYYIRRMGLENRIKVYYLADFNELKILAKDKDHFWFIHTGNSNPQGFNNDHSFVEKSFSHTNDLLQVVKLSPGTL